MLAERKSQSILISGESGAGKTEAMKVALTYIGEVSQGKGGAPDTSKDADPVAARLMQTNPVMEAIGNAKTVRNNNSSRFGKHFDIQFNEQGAILGAFTSVYLLEKPRITEHMKGERNYHVFYMICKSDPSIREPVFADVWEKYKICSQLGTVAEVTSWNDNAEFKDMHAAYLKLGFSEQQRKELYMLFSFCLNVGNVDFEDADGAEGSTITTPEVLEQSAEMLQVAPEDLGEAMTAKTMGGGVIEVFLKPLEARQANGARNSMIQFIYCLLFDWCVDVVNDYIAVSNADFCVGVLDIFGFENFTLNSFPQLCINFTNESLHNLFIEHVFKLEQETYIREEVDWQFVEYEDNQPTLDLISKRPMCIYGLLDEGCSSGAGTDSGVLSNFNGVFKDPKKHKAYIRPKKSADKAFIVNHYAGEVTYDITGFVEKNKDELSLDIEELLTIKSKLEQLVALAKRDAEKRADAEEASASASKKNKGGGKKKKTVSKAFGDSLVALMTKLRATEHHYIRCLKPNQTLKAGDWDNDFMFRQLAYSGTLEVTEIRRAGLNVRRPLAHFYRYYKICAEDQNALRAGTVTKRCELLLDLIGIDENKWRVGKSLVFLKDYEIMDELDKLRETKIIEYVISLQSYFRMCKEMQFFRRFRRYVFRIQGHFKTQAVREAFQEVASASRVVQKYARRRVFLNLYQTTMEECRSAEPGGAVDFVKARASLHKQLMKMNPDLDFFSAKEKPVAQDLGSGPGERRGSTQGQRRGSVQGGRRASISDDPTMPRFRSRHKGWLNASFGKRRDQSVFAYMRLGMLTLYTDETLAAPLISAPLSQTTLSGSEAEVTLLYPKPPNFADIMAKRAAKGGGAVPTPSTESQSITLLPPSNADPSVGLTPSDRVKQFKVKLDAGINEATHMDSDLNLAYNVDVESENADAETGLEVMTEGYLHTKVVTLEELPVTQASLAKAWKAHKAQWVRAYYVLLNNGKLKIYRSAAAAQAPPDEREELGEINIRLFSVAEVEEAQDEAAEEAAKGDKNGKSKKDAKKPVEMKIEGDFYSLVKGKQFDLRNGTTIYRLASGVPAIADEWLEMLQSATTTMYQKSPIFAQSFIKVGLVTGEVTRQLINENTLCVTLVKRMCKEFSLNNDSEWGLYEIWNFAGIPGMPGLKERKVPNNELLLDQTMLKWEASTRNRFGMVAAMPENSFRFELRKASGLVRVTRSKEEVALEFAQAMNDFRDGNFTSPSESNKSGVLTEDHDEAWDIAACAAFKDAFEKRVADAAKAEDEEGLTAERQREIMRELEHNITDMDPEDLEGKEHSYLPAAWFASEVPKPKLADYRKKICARFHELLVEEIVETDPLLDLIDGAVPPIRRLLHDHRMESDPNAYAIMGIVIDRIRRGPKCFATQVLAHMWSKNKPIKPVLLQINYAGLHMYEPGEEADRLLCSFTFVASLISWDALNDMLTLHVVHRASKRSARLHFLTRESFQVKGLLTMYASGVVKELTRLEKEESLRADARARALAA